MAIPKKKKKKNRNSCSFRQAALVGRWSLRDVVPLPWKQLR